MTSGIHPVLENAYWHVYVFVLGYKTVLAFAFGYAYALAVGDHFVRKIVTRMHEGLGEYRKKAIMGHNRALGLIEIVLFVSSIQFEASQFIAFWLGLKAVAGWSHWNRVSFTHYNEEDRTWVTIFGRQAFNIFLAGSGLIIAFAFIGSQLIDWLTEASLLPALVTAIAAPVAAQLLYKNLPPPLDLSGDADPGRRD